MRGWIALVCLLAACDGDGGTGPGGDGGCQFAVTLTGAVTAAFTSSSDFSCAAANNSGGDPIIVFYPDHETLMRFDIEIESELAGMTGEVAGDFNVIDTSGFVWDAECTYAIDRWEGENAQQRLRGTATCPPLMPEAGSATLDATAIAFDMF